jgi:hypothetical protein
VANTHQYLNTSEQKKRFNATQTYSSSKLGIKKSKSKTKAPQNADERSEINDTVIQERNINTTAVELLTLADGKKLESKASSKRISEQSKSELVLCQNL